jgi:hypothetical protein
LQVQRTAEAVTVPKKAQHGIQASEAVAWSPPRAEFKTLTLPTAAPADAETESRIAVWYPCNPLLLERLRANDPAKADALACVRLSVPKELVLGNTANGPATYVGDFSQYAHVSRVLSARGS